MHSLLASSGKLFENPDYHQWVKSAEVANVQGDVAGTTHFALDPIDFVASLLACFFLSLLVRLFYLRFSNNNNFSRFDTANTIPFLAMVVMVVITIIKTSLVLSIGLVGSMSIIRFRTPVKQPEDLVYIFLAIIIGIGMGAQLVVYTFSGVLIILACVMALARLQKIHPTNANDMELYFQLPIALGNTGDALKMAEEKLSKIFNQVKLLRMTNNGASLDVVYRLTGASEADVAPHVDQSMKTCGVSSYSFVSNGE